MSKKEEAEFEEYESLKNSKFKQQKLPGWRPVPSMAGTITIFIILGIVFAGLGVLILLFSNQIVEDIKRYDDICNNTQICPITFKIEKKMVKDIFIYYRIDGFYQNHRRYVKSKSEAQLKGEDISLEDIRESKDCDPIVTNLDMGVHKSYNGSSDLNQSDVAIPCGLMAKNYFNDKFENWTINNEDIKINDTNIARKSDRAMYKNTQHLSKQWLNMEDEHFLVWMRPSPFPNFEKLWGRIPQDLDKGVTLSVNIENNYDVSKFRGKKYLIIRTINNFGGKNIILAIGYIVFGGISLILGIIFFISFKAKAKKEK